MPPRKGPAKEPKPDTGVLAKPLKIKAKAPEGKAAAAGQSAEKKISPAKPRDQVAELKELEERRRQMKEQLRQVEAQIFTLESQYLEKANPRGNALKGYDGLLTSVAGNVKKGLPKAEDRIFSGSSVTGKE